MPRRCLTGWSNNNFKKLHFKVSLETNEITTCAADKTKITLTYCVLFETQVVEMIVKPVHTSHIHHRTYIAHTSHIHHRTYIAHTSHIHIRTYIINTKSGTITASALYTNVVTPASGVARHGGAARLRGHRGADEAMLRACVRYHIVIHYVYIYIYRERERYIIYTHIHIYYV